jgi:hypothetical protein
MQEIEKQKANTYQIPEDSVCGRNDGLDKIPQLFAGKN